MGYGRLYFALNPKGGIKRIAASVYDAFHFRDGSLPQMLADAEGMVNVAEFVVEMEDRAPVRLVSMSFVRYGVLRDGRSDPAHHELHFKTAALKMNEAHRSARTAPPSDLIDTQSIFEGKRLDAACLWSPIDEEWDAFRKILGHRLALGDKNRGDREEAVARLPISERVALAQESAPDWRLRFLAGDTEAIVRMAVAANTYAPSEVLEVLRTDPDPGVIAALAGNHASPKWLSEIANHPSPAVRAGVAGNFRTPDHLVARMAWADPDAG